MIAKFFSRWLPLLGFGGSGRYWERRYRLGGDSGHGSEGAAARYKAAVLNAFVEEHGIGSVIEFGCGDGRQLQLARYPGYVGVDVSRAAVGRCATLFAGEPGRTFVHLDEYDGQRAQLSLSLDVLFHLVEDEVYVPYLDRLFAAGLEYVVVYSTTTEHPPRSLRHVRHRDVVGDIARRFPQFVRMSAEEAALPPPVERGQGLETRFLFYRRVSGA